MCVCCRLSLFQPAPYSSNPLIPVILLSPSSFFSSLHPYFSCSLPVSHSSLIFAHPSVCLSSPNIQSLLYIYNVVKFTPICRHADWMCSVFLTTGRLLLLSNKLFKLKPSCPTYMSSLFLSLIHLFMNKSINNKPFLASSSRPWRESRWTAFNRSCSTSTQWVRVWSRAPPSTPTPRHWSTTWRPPTSDGTHSTSGYDSTCVKPGDLLDLYKLKEYMHSISYGPSLLSSGGRADRPASGGPAALWEIPGCSGASAKLAERHGGAGGQSEASVCRVPRGQGPDPRTEGTRRMKGARSKILFHV